MNEKSNLIKYLLSTWIEEQNTTNLVKIDIRKITNIHQILDKLKDEIQKEKNELLRTILQKELSILSFVYKDLYRLRTKKILSLILSEKPIELENLLPWERKIASTILSTLTAKPLPDIPEILEKEYELSSLVNNSIGLSKSEEPSNIVIAIDSVSQFLGINGVIYRGIKQYDIVLIPKINLKQFKKIKFRIIR